MVKTLLARDLMTRPVKRVWADTPIREAASFLRRHRITGVLVVDDRGRPIGVFTLTDLAEHVRRRLLLPPAVPAREARAKATGEGIPLRRGWQVEALDEATVSEVMSPRIVLVKPTATAPQLARLMADRGHHRVFVEEGGEAAGVVTSMDVLRWIGRSAAKPKPKPR